MTSPCSYHLLSHVSDPDTFKKVKRDFFKLFKRALKRQYKGLKQKAPEVLLVYSIEFKMTDVDEINDTEKAFTEEAKKSTIKLPFLHIHVHVIADCKKTMPQGFPKYALQALNEIDGLTKARYFKTKPRYVSVYNDETKERTSKLVQEKLYKKLNTEFDDVYDRMTYIAKTEQKDRDKIPFKKAFGTSQLTKRKVTTAKVTKIAAT